MNREDICAFAQIPQPSRKPPAFVDDLKRPLSCHFSRGTGCPVGAAQDCMKNGAELKIEFPDAEGLLETAYQSLRRVLTAKGVPEKTGGYPIIFRHDAAFGREE